MPQLYNEVERATFQLLLNKHKESKEFTFSVRKRATKGSESDYFIGTKKANYFAFTLWWIPVNYPGSSADLIDYVVWLRDDRIFFKVEYSISNKAKNAQNASNIQLGKLIEREFTEAGLPLQIYNAPKATYAFALHDTGNYTSIQEYLNALNNFVKNTAPIFDSAIYKNHEKRKNWIAHRITLDQFYNDFLSDLLRRFKKYDGPFEETQYQIQSQKGKEEDIELSPKNKQYFALNSILYGPPGTGKTYSTIDYAVKIAAPARYREGNHVANKEVFEELKGLGQIVFTTFHQSFSYEDFIEGIKPKMESEELTYEIKDGIFKELCTRARAKNERSFEEAFAGLVTELSSLDDDQKLELRTPTGKPFGISLNSNENLNLYTGKDRTKQGVLTKQNILKQLNGEPKFIGWEGYFNGVIDYLKQKHKFSRALNEKSINYVIVIDEINRGNVSQIFGELITLIEADKREKGKEELQVVLPYSKEKFSVPSNLYIIGTMNTADRSVEALDTALRRRFSFVGMFPEPARLLPHELFHSLLWKYKDYEWEDKSYVNVEAAFLKFFGVPKDIQEKRYDLWEKMKMEGYRKEQAEWLNSNYTGVRLDRLLTTINKRIEQLLDKDHTIGHAYFMSMADSIDPETELRLIFHNKIIPLLKEYFYGDLGRVQLILGRKFVKIETSDSNIFADSNYEGAELLSERAMCGFENIMAAEYNIVEAVKSIYEEFDFELNENALEDGIKQITGQVREA